MSEAFRRIDIRNHIINIAIKKKQKFVSLRLNHVATVEPILMELGCSYYNIFLRLPRERRRGWIGGS